MIIEAKKAILLLTLLVSILLFTVRCSSNPCDNLKALVFSCPDAEVSLLLEMVIQANDADACRQYNDAWWITFFPRCYYDGGFPDAGPDGGSGDSGSDSGPVDSGSDGSSMDSGTDGGADGSYIPDGGGDSGSDF